MMEALTDTLDRHLRTTPNLSFVLNPNAGRVRRRMSQPPPPGELNPRLHLTANLDELTALFGSLLLDDSQTVCFYGGDGSIARGLSAMINNLGEDASLPVILPVKAGTVNVLSGYFGLSEPPEDTLLRLREPGRLQRASLPSMKIEVEGELPVYGFMFGWGVAYRVLESYYSRREHPTMADATVVMARTFAQSLHPRATELPLFSRYDLQLQIDGQAPTRPEKDAPLLHSLLVGVLDESTMGIRPLPPEAVAPGRFHFSGNGMQPGQVFRHALPLLFARGDQRELADAYELVAGANVSELRFELREGYTLDGEMIAIEGARSCRISAGPMVQFWSAPQSDSSDL